MRSITKPRRASAEQWHITNECISIGNGLNLTPAFLPQTFPAPMIYFPRSLWLHHFFCRTSGSCFVSTIANAAAAPYQRHSLQLLFILSADMLFFSFRRQEYCSGISRLITVCGLSSLLVNPATAEGPLLRRAVARGLTLRATRADTTADARADT